MAYGILVPQPGIELKPPAVEAQSLNHWPTREYLTSHDIFIKFILSRNIHLRRHIIKNYMYELWIRKLIVKL